MLGSDLMRGSGQRVVSAWRHMGAAGSGLTAYERLFALICRDIQSARAGDHGDQPHIAAWVCRPYINLARSYGAERWPVQALRDYLRERGEREEIADEVWERELRAYRSEKRFLDGQPWNAGSAHSSAIGAAQPLKPAETKGPSELRPSS